MPGNAGAVETQAARLAWLEQRVAMLEERGQQGNADPECIENGRKREWHLPRRAYCLPDPGAFTLGLWWK